MDDRTSLVEFSDEQGRSCAIAPCALAELLLPHYGSTAGLTATRCRQARECAIHDGYGGSRAATSGGEERDAAASRLSVKTAIGISNCDSVAERQARSGRYFRESAAVLAIRPGSSSGGRPNRPTPRANGKPIAIEIRISQVLGDGCLFLKAPSICYAGSCVGTKGNLRSAFLEGKAHVDNYAKRPHDLQPKGQFALDGGYDEGYARCGCFWGRSAGSLVRRFISEMPVQGLQVLDLGCGEGKNAQALARAGATVVGVDCSELAISNGQREFSGLGINWIVSDAESFLLKCEPFDVVIMYGLLHCLPSCARITSLVSLALQKTRFQGYHIVATFNDGPHDLSAHPNFSPTLASHDFYLGQYATQEIVLEATSLIYETHPHNEIPHFHSLTRLVARKVL